MKLPVIENACWGIGDAIVYCWLAASASAAGRPVKICFRRNEDVFRIFGPGDEHMTMERARGDWHPPKGVPGKGGWLKTWLADYGVGDVPFVRPAYREDPEDGEWAEKAWADRDEATGKVTRVLMFPDVAWPIRRWPRSYFVDLAGMLERADCNVLAMSDRKDGCEHMPYGFWGQSIGKVAALIARADLVIGNDSGPVHIAGTIGVRAVAVTGGSRHEMFFEHMPSVVSFALSKDDLDCVGCNFDAKAGFRLACTSGCRALFRTMPEDVYAKIALVLNAEIAKC